MTVRAGSYRSAQEGVDVQAIGRNFDARALERFEQKIRREREGCWIWTGATSVGYGHFLLPGRPKRIIGAHRVSYELHRGQIPPGLVLDHLCRRPVCVNPEHLEVVTQAENMARGHIRDYQAYKTRCPAGHPYSPENTYRPPKGGRVCRVCRLEAKRRHRARGGR